MKNSPSLKLADKLMELSDMTLTVTTNFPRQYAHVFRDRIVKLSVDAVWLVTEANTMRVVDEKSFRECRRYQERTLASIRMLEMLMQQAIRLEVVSTSKMGKWCGLLTEAKRMYYGWVEVYPKLVGTKKN
ncbi:hypothetical protein FWH30_01660 [Microgenomates group bacterium]|nr:hypothetical protein [Microgenomates group bacterium]